MDGLGRMARSSDGDQRNEILRQTALEAHRAHAFGLEADPVMTMDRITAGIAPKMPMDGSFGAPNTPAVDRDAFER
uniref:hypothetical protein n=1 Tax=Brachyspira hyodysenteriae TaxID=159 RepID=UPI001A7E1A5C